MSHQSYAPFGSVSLRIKKGKQKLEDPPGPGSYDVSLPIITPIVRTIRKKNNNVIVKLGHIGTACFQSDQNRFNAEKESDIGPGQYSPEKSLETLERNRSMKVHRTVAGEKLKQLIKEVPRTKAAISEVRSIELGDYVQMPAIEKKKEGRAQRDRVKGAIWSKLTEERGKELMIRSESHIGPGDYEINKPQTIKYPSAAFKSQSIRSFFDQIYYETNQQKIAKERQSKKYKSEHVGPGKYEISSERKMFHKYQFFGSTEERKF